MYWADVKGASGSCFSQSVGGRRASHTVSTLFSIAVVRTASLKAYSACHAGLRALHKLCVVRAAYSACHVGLRALHKLCVVRAAASGDHSSGNSPQHHICPGAKMPPRIAPVQFLLITVKLPTAGMSVRAMLALSGTGLRAWAQASAGWIL